MADVVEAGPRHPRRGGAVAGALALALVAGLAWRAHDAHRAPAPAPSPRQTRAFGSFVTPSPTPPLAPPGQVRVAPGVRVRAAALAPLRAALRETAPLLPEPVGVLVTSDDPRTSWAQALDGVVLVDVNELRYPEFRHEAEMHVFGGAVDAAYLARVARDDIVGESVRTRYDALSGPARAALWLPSYVGAFLLQETGTSEQLYVSALVVARYLPEWLARRVATLPARDRRAVRAYLEAVMASFGPAEEALRRAVPGLAPGG